MPIVTQFDQDTKEIDNPKIIKENDYTNYIAESKFRNKYKYEKITIGNNTLLKLKGDSVMNCKRKLTPEQRLKRNEFLKLLYQYSNFKWSAILEKTDITKYTTVLNGKRTYGAVRNYLNTSTPQKCLSNDDCEVLNGFKSKYLTCYTPAEKDKARPFKEMIRKPKEETINIDNTVKRKGRPPKIKIELNQEEVKAFDEEVDNYLSTFDLLPPLSKFNNHLHKILVNSASKSIKKPIEEITLSNQYCLCRGSQILLVNANLNYIQGAFDILKFMKPEIGSNIVIKQLNYKLDSIEENSKFPPNSFLY